MILQRVRRLLRPDETQIIKWAAEGAGVSSPEYATCETGVIGRGYDSIPLSVQQCCESRWQRG